MKRLLVAIPAILAGVIFTESAGAQTPMASNPVVEVKGKIVKVQVAPGRGMPSLDVEQDGKAIHVVLGAMHYLMQQNFSPKAGEEVEVKGYKAGDTVVASVVTLPAQGKTLRLRDERGYPLWRGRRGRGGRGPGCCGTPSAVQTQ
ncbi:MAG: hypothetical protein ABFD60_13170 [Bryobacteraceae bacterium]